MGTSCTNSRSTKGNEQIMHVQCKYCAEDRAKGNFSEALKCKNCKSTGIVRSREGYICNQCGGNLCPNEDRDEPYGLIDQVVEGGYSSTHLTDTTTYTWSQCEGCLRKMFDGFKIPPTVGEYMLNSGHTTIDNTEPYASEAADRIKSDQQHKANEARFFELLCNNLCTERNGNDYCAKPSIMTSDHSDRTWMYYKHNGCEIHSNDFYVEKNVAITYNKKVFSYDYRCFIGKKCIENFNLHKTVPAPCDLIEKSIIISTMFSFLLNPKTCNDALTVLSNIVKQPRPSTEWLHGVPEAFPPHSSFLGSVANDWLVWGKQQGFANAVAHALLGYSPEHLWSSDG